MRRILSGGDERHAEAPIGQVAVRVLGKLGHHGIEPLPSAVDRARLVRRPLTLALTAS